MNRTVVWVLGTISGVILALTILGPLAFSGGVGLGKSCSASAGAPPCTPTLDQVTFSFGPSLAAAAGFLLLAVLIGLPAWIASPILAARRGASSKPIIIPLAVISLALLVVAFYFAAVSGVVASPKTCFDPDGINCVTGSSAGPLAFVAILITPALASAVIVLPAWSMALVRTARIHAWGWFGAVLLLSPVATLLYGFLGPEQARPSSHEVPPPTATQPAVG